MAESPRNSLFSLPPGPPLPVDAILPALAESLARARRVVLEAPPGAGKTTRVPLAFLSAPWMAARKILMLEPRRIATRAAAARMASTLGEELGETVGYRIRLESRVGPKTRIEVVTEGLLTRRMQSDPALADVGLLIFDEFHERSLNADLGLALAVEAQEALNPELRILVMSATLDGTSVAKALATDEILRADGRMFPVETIYVPTAAHERFAPALASCIRRALRERDGSILAFCPGEAEIRATARELESVADAQTLVLPLFGNLAPADQERALRPAPSGTRKIVLATSIAESSLTIDGVTIVVDGGLSRNQEFDPQTGMTRLTTSRVALASADQRRGRAGRLGPGSCYRLWGEEQNRALKPGIAPEILSADLAPLALELAAWGDVRPEKYLFLDAPPRGAWAGALETLKLLGALDTKSAITPHGREMARFGLHPRLSHMMLMGRARGCASTAAALAALLSERDVVRTRADETIGADIGTRLEIIAGRDGQNPAIDRAALMRARENARNFCRMLGAKFENVDPAMAGELTAYAYPGRIAKARDARGGFLLRNGRGATLSAHDHLAGASFLAIAALDQGNENARIFLAAPMTEGDVATLFADHITTQGETLWDNARGLVVARERKMLGAITLTERAVRNPDPEAVMRTVSDAIAARGLGTLPWSEELTALRARVAFLRRVFPDDATLPDLSDEALIASREKWLEPFLAGITRATDFPRIDLAAALGSLLDHRTRRRIDEDAPTHVEVPSGSRIRVDYDAPEPVLAVKLQEMFGLADGPRIARGKMPLTLHLLSPAGRPVQVTRDLKGFWERTYAEVKRDLKGRYPRHPWPDDPWNATPTRRLKPRGT